MKPALLVAAVLFVGGSACRNATGPSEHSVVLDVETMGAPATISSTSPIDVVLNVLRSACQSFQRIEAERSASAVKLTVVGKDPEKGCIDLGILEPRTYRIDPPFAAGAFTITVNRGRLSPLIATVQVQ